MKKTTQNPWTLQPGPWTPPPVPRHLRREQDRERIDRDTLKRLHCPSPAADVIAALEAA